MDSESMVAESAADVQIVDAIASALIEGALPGELEGFTDKDRIEAARFLANCALSRPRGTPLIRLETLGGALGERHMRIAIINDDMPFLVDSIANTLAARGLTVRRLLHPVVCVERDENDGLTLVRPACDEDEKRESIIYLEVARDDARGRRELIADLRRTLADVRAAVDDWERMRARMHADAEGIEDEEGRALLHWFADGAMTLLGFEIERPGSQSTDRLGLFKLPGDPTDEGGCEGAMRYFARGGEEPLMAKGDRRSTVHRRVPLDLVVVPVRGKDGIEGVGVHVGLWTSQALSAPVEDVPVLRRRLAELEANLGFEPSGHSGKALRLALNALPHDLLINLDIQSVRELVLNAMSLADRPRPTIVLARSILKGHLFAFVWLPRDELTTRRRVAISEMIARAAEGQMTNWSVELGDGDLALVRYTFTIDSARPNPDAAELDRQIDAMVRGWEPSVEAQLTELTGGNRATRLAIAYAPAFPNAYRDRYGAADAARDIVRLHKLGSDRARSVRLYRLDVDSDSQIRLKIYRLGGLVRLSDVVPVLEFFGFKVLKETPTRLDGDMGNIHEFVLETADGSAAEPVMARADVVEQAIAAVLEGHAENDAFNQLIVSTGLDQRSVVLLRAWFR
jgi:glutamate dehydrogenase